MIGASPWDDDPRVSEVIAEYEAFYLTDDGKRLDAATVSREAFAALPEEIKERAESLSFRLMTERRRVRTARKQSQS